MVSHMVNITGQIRELDTLVNAIREISSSSASRQSQN
jgi:hypothetical protein